MPVNIVLPTLSAWAASHLGRLFESKTQADFDAAFDATFVRVCNITVNGKHLERDQYKALLLQQSGAAPLESSATVNIEGQTEVEGSDGQLSGLVGLFYTTLSDSKYLVLGAPAESRASSSLNLAIEPTEKNPQEGSKLHFHGYFDPRRVVTVNQVVAEDTYHVSIPAVSIPKGTTTNVAPGTKTELGPGPLQLPPNFGPFGGNYGPGPVRLPFGVRYGAGPLHLPPTETGAKTETLPGFGAFGVGPVIIPGETVGEETHHDA